MDGHSSRGGDRYSDKSSGDGEKERGHDENAHPYSRFASC